MSTTPPMHPDRRRWPFPLFCVALGAIMGVAALIGGRPGFAAFAFLLMTAMGAAFYFLTGNETLQGLGGPQRDERWEMIDLRATASAFGVTILVLLALWIADLVQGDKSSPYVTPLAVGGFSYMLFVAWFKRRS